MNICLKLTVTLFLTVLGVFKFFLEGKGFLNHKFCWFSSSVWFFPCSTPTKLFVTLNYPSNETMMVRILTQISATPAPKAAGLEHQSSSSARALLRSVGIFPVWAIFGILQYPAVIPGGSVRMGEVLTWWQSICVYFFPANHTNPGGFLCWSCLWSRLAVGTEIPSSFWHSWSCVGVQGLLKIIF